MMGNTRTDLSAEEQTISGELTTAYAAYIDRLGLTDENGESLTLEASADGRYQAGSYYDYMKEIIEKSLNNFLADTSFPYDADAASSHGGPGGMGPGAGGMGPRDGAAPGGDEAKAGSIGASTDFTAIDQIQRKENSAGLKISGTFATAQDYIDALNADGTWVNYDAATGTATITSIADFAAAVKTASKGIAAFDQLDASQGENTLFGYGDGAGVHFDATLAEILETIGSSYATDYSDDMSRVDALGHSVADRVKMYSPSITCWRPPKATRARTSRILPHQHRPLAGRHRREYRSEPCAGARELRRVRRLQLRLGPGPHHGRAERRRHQQLHRLGEQLRIDWFYRG